MTDNELLIQTIRCGLGISPMLNGLQRPNWANIFQVASKQGVAAIAWDGIQRLLDDGLLTPEQMPNKALKLQWALLAEQTETRYAKQRKTIVKLADLYAENGIKMLILKGYGLSLMYPVPQHRRCSDVDIWLFGEQQHADEIVRKSLGINIDEGRHHHTVFYVDGVMIENHYDFLNIHSHRSNRDIEARLKVLAAEPESFEVEGRTIYRPNTNCHALFLLRHAASHFAAVGIVLRHIIDWAMFVKHNHQAIDWPWLREVCRVHNMELFLDAINGLAMELCDINPTYFANTTRRPDIERRILGDMLSPEFTTPPPQSGLMHIVAYKFRRWWANRWKHRIVYRDGLLRSFITQMFSHLAKPKSIKQL